MLFYMLFAAALFLRVSVFRFVGTLLFLLATGSLFRQNDWPAVSFYLSSIVLDFFFGMLIARACLRGKYLPREVAVLSVFAGLLYFSFSGHDPEHVHRWCSRRNDHRGRCWA